MLIGVTTTLVQLDDSNEKNYFIFGETQLIIALKYIQLNVIVSFIVEKKNTN